MYLELSVGVAEEASEGLTNFLWEAGALGVIEEETASAAPRLRAFFPDGPADVLAARVDAYLEGLRALGFGVDGPARVAPLVDGDWAEAWRAHFRPVAVGRALVIAPPWDVPPDGGRVVLAIEPGRAFGTGHHGSTAGCLRLVEAIVERDRPARAIDVGTGSGILAIAAARLGVPSVLAFDDDPDAVAAAVDNAARNGVAARVRCLVADVNHLDTEPAPLVVANLLAAAHRRLGPRYRDLAAPGGSLVAGGILDAEAADIAGALAAHGFAPAGAVSMDGWTTLELRAAPVHDHA